jgi:hypothetical protein
MAMAMERNDGYGDVGIEEQRTRCVSGGGELEPAVWLC